MIPRFNRITFGKHSIKRMLTEINKFKRKIRKSGLIRWSLDGR